MSVFLSILCIVVFLKLFASECTFYVSPDGSGDCLNTHGTIQSCSEIIYSTTECPSDKQRIVYFASGVYQLNVSLGSYETENTIQIVFRGEQCWNEQQCSSNIKLEGWNNVGMDIRNSLVRFEYFHADIRSKGYFIHSVSSSFEFDHTTFTWYEDGGLIDSLQSKDNFLTLHQSEFNWTHYSVDLFADMDIVLIKNCKFTSLVSPKKSLCLYNGTSYIIQDSTFLNVHLSIQNFLNLTMQRVTSVETFGKFTEVKIMNGHSVVIENYFQEGEIPFGVTNLRGSLTVTNLTVSNARKSITTIKYVEGIILFQNVVLNQAWAMGSFDLVNDLIIDGLSQELNTKSISHKHILVDCKRNAPSVFFKNMAANRVTQTQGRVDYNVKNCGLLSFDNVILSGGDTGISAMMFDIDVKHISFHRLKLVNYEIPNLFFSTVSRHSESMHISKSEFSNLFIKSSIFEKPKEINFNLTVEDSTFKQIHSSKEMFKWGSATSPITEITKEQLIIRNCRFQDGPTALSISIAPIMNRKFEFLIENSTFTNLRGSDGGAISLRGQEIQQVIDSFSFFLAIRSSVFQENEASSDRNGGGGIYINTGTYTHSTSLQNIFIENNIFRKNKAYKGSAIFLSRTGVVVLKGNLFENNHALWDGTLYITQSTKTIVDNSKFVSNIAQINGGGIMAYSPLLVRNTKFLKNRSPSGSAMSLRKCEDHVIHDCEIQQNSGGSMVAVRDVKSSQFSNIFFWHNEGTSMIELINTQNMTFIEGTFTSNLYTFGIYLSFRNHKITFVKVGFQYNTLMNSNMFLEGEFGRIRIYECTFYRSLVNSDHYLQASGGISSHSNFNSSDIPPKDILWIENSKFIGYSEDAFRETVPVGAFQLQSTHSFRMENCYFEQIPGFAAILLQNGMPDEETYAMMEIIGCHFVTLSSPAFHMQISPSENSETKMLVKDSTFQRFKPFKAMRFANGIFFLIHLDQLFMQNVTMIDNNHHDLLLSCEYIKGVDLDTVLVTYTRFMLSPRTPILEFRNVNDLKVKNSEFSHAASAVSLMSLHNTNAQFHSNVFKDCIGHDAGVVAISGKESRKALFSDCLFLRNSALPSEVPYEKLESRGGALTIEVNNDHYELILRNVIFDGNTASSIGGSIYSWNSLTLEDVVIKNGRAQLGSAIYSRLGKNGTIVVKGATKMTRNEATVGGTVFFEANRVDLPASIFHDNFGKSFHTVATSPVSSVIPQFKEEYEVVPGNPMIIEEFIDLRDQFGRSVLPFFYNCTVQFVDYDKILQTKENKPFQSLQLETSPNNASRIPPIVFDIIVGSSFSLKLTCKALSTSETIFFPMVHQNSKLLEQRNLQDDPINVREPEWIFTVYIRTCDRAFYTATSSKLRCKLQVELVVISILMPVCFLFCCCTFCLLSICLFTTGWLNWRKFKINKKNREIELHLMEENRVNFSVDASMFEIKFKDIEIKDKIGGGGSGCVVYSGIFKKHIPVAIKIFKPSNDYLAFHQDFEKETKILASLRHEHIIQFIGATLLGRVGIITELCSYDLSQYLTNNPGLSLETKTKILFEIAAGMSYLHHHGILHRDLKCENILMTEEGVVKLTDFGESKKLKQNESNVKMTTMVGTNITMAPEVVKSSKYTGYCDVYSFGIVMWIVMKQDPNPYGPEPKGVEIRVANNSNYRPLVDEHFGPEWYVSLMRQCWSHSPSKRPSFDDILNQLDAVLDKFV